jgi:hypothetical protein
MRTVRCGRHQTRGSSRAAPSPAGLSAFGPFHPDADAERILKMCRDKGIIAATNATPDDVKAKMEAGYKLISVGWDFGLLQKALGDTIKNLRAAIK